MRGHKQVAATGITHDSRDFLVPPHPPTNTHITTAHNYTRTHARTAAAAATAPHLRRVQHPRLHAHTQKL
jgi:hypothetical protein